MNKKRRTNDFILIAVLIAIPLVILLLNSFLRNNAKGDAFVVITVKGELFDKVPLDEQNVFEIETNLGTNRIEIKDGQVSITHADCPDKLCVYHKPIDNRGGQIVCLPNQVVVSVETNNGEIDSHSE